jgi:hypothetical protein
MLLLTRPKQANTALRYIAAGYDTIYHAGSLLGSENNIFLKDNHYFLKILNRSEHKSANRTKSISFQVLLAPFLID